MINLLVCLIYFNLTCSMPIQYNSVIPESMRWLYAVKKNERAADLVKKMAHCNRVEFDQPIEVTLKVR